MARSYHVLKAGILGVVIVASCASGAAAQGSAQAVEAEQVRARQRIFIMEGILERAVEVGIDTLRRQLSGVMPDDMLLVAGDGPQARGFRLDGYGVFFDVEVPAVRPSLAWSLRTMNETAALFLRDLSQMRERIRQSVADEATRAELERGLARIQQQVVPQQVAGPAPSDPRAVAASQTVAAQAPAVGPALSLDPGLAYTQAVKTALVDAMLENSGSLALGPEEWLTVAARDNSQGGGVVASDPSDVITIVLRVKGSDITAFRTGTLTAEQVRQKVEVRAF
jgi:hypothetical protein